jgi:hypothetical protein
MPGVDRSQVIQLYSLLADMARREQSNQALAAVMGGGQVVGGTGGSASANYGPKVSGRMPPPQVGAMSDQDIAMQMSRVGTSPNEAIRHVPGRRVAAIEPPLIDEFGYDPALDEFMEEVRRQKALDWISKMAGALSTADALRGGGR